MEVESKFNKNAQTFHFGKSAMSKNFEEFFTLLFSSWKADNVDSIVSRVNLESMNETEMFFEQLFSNIFRLASQSATKIKADNVIMVIDTLDQIMPELLMKKSSNSYEIIVEEYNGIKIRSFLACFNPIRGCCTLFNEVKSEMILNEIRNVLLILSKLSKLKYNEIFVYNFANFLWGIFHDYRNVNELIDIVLFSLSSIADQLVTFVLVYVDRMNNNLIWRDLALEILQTLKTDLIYARFVSSQIPYVLNILEKYNRLIGRYHDAIPENRLLEDGYILCCSFTTALESDEFYEDYEKFKSFLS